jgi:flagellar protein FliO/FliZ
MLSTPRKIIILIALLVMPIMAAAADVTTINHHSLGSDNPISLSSVMQILASFAAVIAFIFFMAWLVRKTGRFGISNNKSIRVISSMSLGMREKIVLISVEDVNIVVGVAPGQIRTLHVLGKGPHKSDSDGNKDSDMFGRIMGGFSK